MGRLKFIFKPFLSQISRFQNSFEADHLKVLSSPKNGSYLLVRAQKPGTTVINSVFYGQNKANSTPKKIIGHQEIKIYFPVVVDQKTLVFPFDPETQYEYKIEVGFILTQRH
jgi:hypothetical protein